MGFNRLLWSCLKEDRRLSEKGIGVSSSHQPGESILCFHIDCAAYRQCANHQGVLCDGLFFYQYNGGQPHIIFTELKANDLSHAIDQLTATFDLVFSGVPQSLRPPRASRVTALVVSRHGVPRKSRGVVVKRPGVKTVVKSGVNTVVPLEKCVTLR